MLIIAAWIMLSSIAAYVIAAGMGKCKSWDE